MYNKKKFNKINDKKILHKVRKQWVVLSLSMLAMIGAGGAIAAQTHASTVNAPQVQQEKQVAPQQTPNVGKESTPAKPVIKLSAQTQKTPVSNTNNGNKGKQLSLSDDTSNAVHQTPSIDDIISAVDSNTWNSQYGSKYTDLLSNLNYNNVQVFDNPTAYNNYFFGNNNVNSTNKYLNALYSVQKDLNGFTAYPKVQKLQNLMNIPVSHPASYSSLYSNPLFDGFEDNFNQNDINAYNSIMNNFGSLELDRTDKSKQAIDLQNALNGLNSLSTNARNAVVNFFGIPLSDINNEIDNLNNGNVSQEMDYQPIKLVYYDISARQDMNANNEVYTSSRAPVGSTILRESEFGMADPYTLVPNQNYNSRNPDAAPNFIADTKLNVPNGEVWDGLADPNGNNEIYDTADGDDDSGNTTDSNDGLPGVDQGYRNYFLPPEQQLHFHLVPASEANQPETVIAYVRAADGAIGNPSGLPGMSYLMNNYNYQDDDYKNVYMLYNQNDHSLRIGGDFSAYCQNGGSIIPSELLNQIQTLYLDDSVNLNGNCSYMFANMPNLRHVVRIGKFDVNKHDGGIYYNGPKDISHMFENDPNLYDVEDEVNLPWNFSHMYNDNGSYVFNNDVRLVTINGLHNWQTAGLTNMDGMFYNDYSLRDLSPISNWDVGGVHQMDKMFANDYNVQSRIDSSSLQDISSWDLRGLETAEELFGNDEGITNIPESWMNKPIDTGSTYPNVIGAFQNTAWENNQNLRGNPDWQPSMANNNLWLPNMYRTENGHYSFTPDPNAIYFGPQSQAGVNPADTGFNGIFYKNDGYLVLSNADYTQDTEQANDNSGNVFNYDVNNQNPVQLPSRDELVNYLNNAGIRLSDIRKINIVGDNQFNIPKYIPKSGNEPAKGSLINYFADMPNLQSIQGGNELVNPHSYYVDASGLFAHDPELDDVIGFFGNEQNLQQQQSIPQQQEDPYAGQEAQGLANKYTTDKTGIHVIGVPNPLMNAQSTANMFDGDGNLFADSNAQANVDAISSIPMDNITDASYMFNNTGLTDGNIVTNWDLSKLQKANHMFAGCNLTNLNGLSELGKWTDNHEGPIYTETQENDWVDNGSSDDVQKIAPHQLQDTSYMFANNPHLTDVSSIENGNNNWKFNQKPNVSDMFSNTNVGYDSPKVNSVDGQYVLGAMPKQDTDHIIFNGYSSKNTTVHGDDGATSNAVAPQGYHFINNSNGQFTFNNGNHSFDVSPDVVQVPVEFKDTSNNQLVDPDISESFTVNVPSTVSFDNNESSKLHQQGYQLNDSNNYNFTVAPNEVNNDGKYTGSKLVFNITPINFTIPVEYKNNNVIKSTNSITNQTVHSTPNLMQYAQENVPSGYQLVTNGQNNDLSTWKVADHIQSSSNTTDPLVVYIDPVQAKAEVKYIDNNGAVNPNPSVIGSGDEDSSIKVGSTPAGLPNGYTVTNPNQSITYNNQAQNVNVAPENFNVPFNVVTSSNSNVLFNGTSTNKVTVDSSANLELPITTINSALRGKGYVLKNPNTNFTLKHGDITNANKFNVEDTPSFAASDISATLPIKLEDTENHNQVIGNIQTITGVKANTQNNISSEINVPTNYQLASGNVDLTKYSFNNANLSADNKVTPLVVYVRPVQQQALVVYKNGNTPVNSTPISLGSGDTSALNLASSKFEIGAHPSTLPTGYQISNPSQVMYYDNQSQDVAVTPIQATSTINYEYNDHDVTDNASTKSVTGNQSVGKTTFNLASLTVPNGYQLSATNPVTDAYSSNHITVNVIPVQATDSIVYKSGSQTIAGDSNSTNSVTGNKVIAPNSFNTSNLVLPNGYKLAGNGTTQTYNGNQVVVQVVPKSTMTTVHYVYDGQPLTTTTKQGLYNASFDTNSLSLPNGYNLANGNQTISDSNANVNVDLVPQQKTDTINFVDNKGHVTTTYVSGNSSATGLASSHFTVGNTPNGLPSGYQVEDPTQVINYDGTNHTIMIKPNKPSVKPTPSNNKSGNKPNNNKPSVKPTPSNNNKSGNKPNNNKPSVKPTPGNHNKSGNKPNNKPSVNPTPGNNKSGNKPNNNKPSVKPTPGNHNKSGNKPNNNKPSVKPTPSNNNKSGNKPNNNKPSVKPTPGNHNKSGNKPNNKPSVNPTPGNNKSGNKPNNKPSVNPQTNPQPIIPINWNSPINPIMPATSSSANNVSMASTTNHVSSNVTPTMGRASVAKNPNLHASSKNKVTVKYAKVVKAISLHTNRNFTRKNVVKTIKPGAVFRIEKAVKSHNGALRYEVYYNKKNYFIIANKRLVNVYYKAAKHVNHNHSVNNYIHYRYAKVIKALQLHTNAKFTKRNGIRVVRSGAEFHINRIVRNHGLVRYEIRYQGRNYFITANRNYTVNAYLQKNNFSKHGYKAVRVIKPLNEYRKLSFVKRNLIHYFNRGSVLPVKKVITIASGKMTRLQLTNGHYVTSNKNYVEVVK